MRTKYWNFLANIIFQMEYCHLYYARLQAIDRWLTAATTFASATGIAAWWIWQQVPWLWSIIIALSQIINVLKPLLPYSKQMGALKFYIPEIGSVLLETEAYWNRTVDNDNKEDAVEILTTYHRFKSNIHELETKYFGADIIPENKRVMTKAMKNSEREYEISFLVKAEE